MSGVVEYSFQECLVAGGFSFQEEGVTAHARHHIINENADFVPQTLVIQLVTFLQNTLKGSSQGQNYLLLTCH